MNAKYVGTVTERTMASSVEPALQPVLEARGINKHFGPVQALRNVDLSVFPGEVVALIGDNSAGKSTLINVLTGVLPLESGEIVFAGEQVRFSSPQEARAHGIETVYQDLAVAPHLERRLVTLSGGQRQGVAVARAVMWASKVVIMDEPTAALGVAQTAKVL